jgi:hypothetical protein
MNRGWLAIATSQLTPRTTRVTVRRVGSYTGSRTLRWTEQGRPVDMDLGRRRLLLVLGNHADDQLWLTMVGGPGPKRRMLVADDAFDEDCKCTTSSRDLHSASFDGRYAYWLEVERRSLDEYPLGGGARFSEVDRVFRTDTNTRRQPNQAVELPRSVPDISVDRGRVFYAPFDGTGHVYRFTPPAFQPMGSGRRVLGPPRP